MYGALLRTLAAARDLSSILLPQRRNRLRFSAAAPEENRGNGLDPPAKRSGNRLRSRVYGVYSTGCATKLK
jgi:hypothetical protein